MSDKMREEFEEWFSYNYKWFIEKDMGGYSLARFPEGQMQYIDQIPHHDWRVWQASRAALVVELPNRMAYEQLDSCGVFVCLSYELNPGSAGDTVELARLRDVIEAIHAAGVKTK